MVCKRSKCSWTEILDVEFKSQHSVNKQRQFNFDFNVSLSENLYIALELVKQRMQ